MLTKKRKKDEKRSFGDLEKRALLLSLSHTKINCSEFS